MFTVSRSRRVSRGYSFGLVVATAALLPAGAAAQQSPAVGLGAGFTSYDLAGTGTVFVVNGVLDLPLSPFLVFQPGVAYFRYDPGYDASQASLYPELSLQLQIPSSIVNPYLGAGAGWALSVEGRSLRDNMKVTLHAAVGVRAWIVNRWGAQIEARLRSIDPFAGNSFDITGGVHYQLRARQ